MYNFQNKAACFFFFVFFTTFAATNDLVVVESLSLTTRREVVHEGHIHQNFLKSRFLEQEELFQQWWRLEGDKQGLSFDTMLGGGAALRNARRSFLNKNTAMSEEQRERVVKERWALLSNANKISLAAYEYSLEVDPSVSKIIEESIFGNSFTGIVRLCHSQKKGVLFIAPLQAGSGSKYTNIPYPKEKMLVGTKEVGNFGFDHTPLNMQAAGDGGKLAGHQQLRNHIAAQHEVTDPTGNFTETEDVDYIGWALNVGDLSNKNRKRRRAAFSFNSQSLNSANFVRRSADFLVAANPLVTKKWASQIITKIGAELNIHQVVKKAQLGVVGGGGVNRPPVNAPKVGRIPLPPPGDAPKKLPKKNWRGTSLLVPGGQHA